MHERRNNEYSFVDSSYKNYQNNHSKLVFIHNHCGTKFSKSLYHLFNDKYPCPKCSKEFKSYNIKKLTDEEYKGFLKGNILKYQLRLGKKDEVSKEIEKIEDYKRELKNEN